MVDRGHVTDANEAFARYLGAGKMGDVKTCWPALEEVVAWISGAGGAAVLAHPLKYKMTRTKLRRLIAAFQKAGGTVLEVYSGRQSREQTLDLCQLSRACGLQASVGSDFHAHVEHGPRLGVETTALPGIVDLWHPDGSRNAA